MTQGVCLCSDRVAGDLLWEGVAYGLRGFGRFDSGRKGSCPDGVFLLYVLGRDGCDGIIERAVSGEGRTSGQDIRKRLQFLPGEQHERETGE